MRLRAKAPNNEYLAYQDCQHCNNDSDMRLITQENTAAIQNASIFTKIFNILFVTGSQK